METTWPATARHRGIAVMLSALLVGCASGCRDDHPVVSNSSAKSVDDPGNTACTLFADRYRHAGTSSARLGLADDVGRHAFRSANGAIAGRAGAVGRSANRGTASWRAASAGFLRACRDAGWRPAKAAP